MYSSYWIRLPQSFYTNSYPHTRIHMNFEFLCISQKLKNGIITLGKDFWHHKFFSNDLITVTRNLHKCHKKKKRKNVQVETFRFVEESKSIRNRATCLLCNCHNSTWSCKTYSMPLQNNTTRDEKNVSYDENKMNNSEIWNMKSDNFLLKRAKYHADFRMCVVAHGYFLQGLQFSSRHNRFFSFAKMPLCVTFKRMTHITIILWLIDIVIFVSCEAKQGQLHNKFYFSKEKMDSELMKYTCIWLCHLLTI